MEKPEGSGAASVEFVGLSEARPVCKDSKGSLIVGNTHQFIDLLLRNYKGVEKIVRLPVTPDVIEFFAGE